MAILGPYVNAYVLVNGVDLSDHVDTATLTLARDDVDVTAMGAFGHQHIASLENDKVDLIFFQDYGASKVDATLFPLFHAGTAFAFKMAGNGSTISGSNPSYSGTVTLMDYSPLGGKVGVAAMSPVSLVFNGTVSEGTT